MEDNLTILQRIRKLETYIYGLPAFVDTDALDGAALRAMRQVRSSVSDARSMLRDYEALEDDHRAQAQVLSESIEGLERLRADILEASQHNLVDAIDVAQLSAQIEQMIERLR